MSNILFSKKFIAKLTAIICTFWWMGVGEEKTTHALCLKAWKDICSPKKEGGLGIRNLQAVNQSLILMAAWRIAQKNLMMRFTKFSKPNISRIPLYGVLRLMCPNQLSGPLFLKFFTFLRPTPFIS